MTPEIKRCLKCESVDIEHRVVVSLYMCSRSWYLAPTWPALNAGEAKDMHHNRMFFYRVLLQRDFDADKQYISDASVLQAVSAPAPKILIMVWRLSLFCRICKNCMSSVRDLLSCIMRDERSWLQAVLSDLRFFRGSTIYYTRRLGRWQSAASGLVKSQEHFQAVKFNFK